MNPRPFNTAPRDRVAQGLNMSCDCRRISCDVASSSFPNKRRKRLSERLRIWSKATCPGLPPKTHSTRHGYDLPLEVKGAANAVRTAWFKSSGESTTQGRVLRISSPSVGSSRTSQTSNLFIGWGVGPLPFARVPLVWDILPFLKLGRQVVASFAHLSRGLCPPLAHRARGRRHNQLAILHRHRGFAAEAARLNQFLGQEQTKPITDLFDLRLHADNLRSLATTGNPFPDMP